MNGFKLPYEIIGQNVRMALQESCPVGVSLMRKYRKFASGDDDFETEAFSNVHNLARTKLRWIWDH